MRTRPQIAAFSQIIIVIISLALAQIAQASPRFRVLHAFGKNKDAGPLDGQGNIDGTTATGGKQGYGVVFEITP